MTAAPTVVVGGGIGGASAALELATAGEPVVLLESSPNLGGLLVSFEVGGSPLECFYHHLFPHETHILELIERLGLGDRLEWFDSSVAMLVDGEVWPFTSPVDLLRFRPLPPLDRIRTGIGALRMTRHERWEPLDELPARDWLRQHTGQRAVETIWDPLLRAKFGPAAPRVPAAWMWARFDQRSGARRSSGEVLGYLRGGFRQLFDALHARLEELGAEVRTSTRATGFELRGTRLTGVATDRGTIETNSALFTGPLPVLPDLVPDGHVDARWQDARALGAMVVVLELAEPLTSQYWINVCDDLPFGGIIEHTNFVPAADYAGRHVVYLGRYFTHDEPVASVNPDAEAERWIAALPGVLDRFAPEDVLDQHAFRTPYAAPLVTVGYRERIPPMRSHLDGLYLATTAQIYPKDRGMSEGVRLGRQAARTVLGDRMSVIASRPAGPGDG